MSDGQFAVIACALLTIAILVGGAWRAVVVFVGVCFGWIAYDWLEARAKRWRSRRRNRRRDDAYRALLDRTER
jgi:hypothetical protein